MQEKFTKRKVRLFSIDKTADFEYNDYILNFYGPARVSTGILRYDKRGGLNNPVKLFNFKNKRQQHCCSCSVSCDAAKSAARTADEDYDFRRASNLVVNLNSEFALASVRH